MHSATKYLNGHSDVVAGALCFARDDALCARARTIRTVARNDPASVRGVPADPRPENARLARARGGGERDGAREPALQSRGGLRGALSRPPASSGPRRRAPPDEGRTSEECCRSASAAAPRLRSRPQPGCACGSGRPLLAGSNRSSNIAPRSRAQTRHVRLTCCDYRPESKTSKTFGAILIRRWTGRPKGPISAARRIRLNRPNVP